MHRRPRDLAQRRNVGAGHGNAGSHRFQYRHPEAFERGRIDESQGAAEQLVQLLARNPAGDFAPIRPGQASRSRSAANPRTPVRSLAGRIVHLSVHAQQPLQILVRMRGGDAQQIVLRLAALSRSRGTRVPRRDGSPARRPAVVALQIVPRRLGDRDERRATPRRRPQRRNSRTADRTSENIPDGACAADRETR